MALNTTHSVKEIQQLAQNYGISYSTLRRRILAGMDLTTALTTPAIGHNKYYSLFGKRKNLNEWRLEFGVNPNTLLSNMKKRVENGMSEAYALADYAVYLYVSGRYPETSQLYIQFQRISQRQTTVSWTEIIRTEIKPRFSPV